MNEKEISTTHQAVIEALKENHLTSFQILKKIGNISLILILYNILDDLKSMGILKSYMKEGAKYHYLTLESR